VAHAAELTEAGKVFLAGVKEMPLTAAAPTSASKSLICWLSGGWQIPTLAAALVNCLSSATARKYRMWRSSIVISKTDHKSLYHIFDQ
jgi:hypothetical protein